MHEQSERFRTLLIDFARSIGKEDAEVYVDDGFWKARQGGNGVAYAQKSVISFKPCATEENAFNYELQKPVTEELYELFRPFGYLNFDMGNARLGEVFILNRAPAFSDKASIEDFLLGKTEEVPPRKKTFLR